MIVVIAHIKGGTGKTTTATQVALRGRSLIQSERCGLWMLTSSSHRLTRSASEVN